jgi:hypothetical protein
LDEENYYEPFDDVVPSSNRIRKGPSHFWETMSPNAVTQEYLHSPSKVTLYGDGDVSTLGGARAKKLLVPCGVSRQWQMLSISVQRERAEAARIVTLKF